MPNFSEPLKNQTIPFSLPLPSFAEAVAWGAVFMAVVVAGLVGNLLLSLAVFKDPQLRKGAGVLVLWTLSVNFVITVVLSPVFPFVWYGRNWWNVQYPDWMCVVFGSIYGIASYSLNWAEFFLGLNRFVAVFVPHGYKRWTTKNALAMQISIGTLVAFILSILPVFHVTATYTLTATGTCAITPASGLQISVAFSYYVPLSAVGFVYLMIVMRFFYGKYAKKEKQNEQHESEANERRRNRRMYLARALLLSFLWVCMAYLPGSIAILFRKSMMTSLAIKLVSTAGPALAPMILILTNVQYRTACLNLVKKSNRLRPLFSGTSESNSTRGRKGTGISKGTKLSAFSSM